MTRKWFATAGAIAFVALTSCAAPGEGGVNDLSGREYIDQKYEQCLAHGGSFKGDAYNVTFTCTLPANAQPTEGATSVNP